MNHNFFVWVISIIINILWELHKDAVCCHEQILEAALHETATVWPLTYHLTNHPSMTNKTCWALLEK